MRVNISPVRWITLLAVTAIALPAVADPCGMVPPIYLGEGLPITRIGEQQTYVFHKDGVETFVIRPGFSGKVDEFGMLIPFPKPPTIRKVPDHVFTHLAAAVDPPEVVVDLTPRPTRRFFARDTKSAAPGSVTGLKYDAVRVLRQEAVGMYEVTVLEAGSAAALKRWLDQHEYKYPEGMDKPCNEYVAEGWCFVAVKTKVGQKQGVEPRPGQRNVNAKLPSGSTFDGQVQAMGFRFKSDELVVPMRLSAFNAGELRNIVYILSDGPRKIRSIPEEYVVRQIEGPRLLKNVTDLLPLRIIGGTEADIPDYRRKSLPQERDPHPKNGAAKELFAADLLAVSSGQLSLPHEEKEKELLRIGERFGLRGAEIDAINEQALAADRQKTVAKAAEGLKNMSLTVVDGDFPREVLGSKNLTFAEYKMPARRNKPELYDAKNHGPGGKKEGVLKLGRLDDVPPAGIHPREQDAGNQQQVAARRPLVWGLVALSAALVGLTLVRRRKLTVVLLTLATMLAAGTALADPCGMVPPIYLGEGVPITRVGEQQTYVFYRDGVETFVIRPGFQGKVDEFGMLIPFPTPPEIRKVSDDIFSHVAAAIDPPEVVVDLRFDLLAKNAVRRGAGKAELDKRDNLKFKDQVRVLKQEAVGMYEVAVLEAGSSAALKRWMDQHGYKYPDGMDRACDDYVQQGWCFVAVKTKVGQKQGVEPRPGQRDVSAKLPSGSTFDGAVQAMGFRFKSDELVVPMRLSSFNAGELRNIVYLLTDGPRKVRAIPEEYVVRQISGEQLFRNVTEPLPLRIIGGTEADIPDYRRKMLPAERDPAPKNGAAKELFAADLLAVSSGKLSLPHEEREKELLRIGERFGLRGGQIDGVNTQALAEARAKTVAEGLQGLKKMTLTVIDGDFPREVLAKQNLSFAEYTMPGKRNDSTIYDAKLKGPGPKQQGVLKLGALDVVSPTVEQVGHKEGAAAHARRSTAWLAAGLGLGLIGLAVACRRRSLAVAASLVVIATAAVLLSGTATAQEKKPADGKKPTIRQLLDQLSDPKTAEPAVKALAARGEEAKEQLSGEAIEGNDLTRRGWAIIALSEIGGQDVDELFLKIHKDEKQPMLVRTWAAAGRVYMTNSADALIEKASLVQQFPAVGRPLGMRLVDKLAGGPEGASAEGLIKVTLQVAQLRQALAPAILALGPEKLASVMSTGQDNNVRNMAAAYLGTLHGQGNKKVPGVVISTYQFDPKAKEVPWKGGALWVPGIQWPKEEARALVGNLIRWHLWCDRNNRGSEQQQIHNNIRGVGLAQMAGYQSPGFQNVDTVQWLATWGKAVGKEELAKLLKEQGADQQAKYAAVLEKL